MLKHDARTGFIAVNLPVPLRQRLGFTIDHDAFRNGKPVIADSLCNHQSRFSTIHISYPNVSMRIDEAEVTARLVYVGNAITLFTQQKTGKTRILCYLRIILCIFLLACLTDQGAANDLGDLFERFVCDGPLAPSVAE